MKNHSWVLVTLFALLNLALSAPATAHEKNDPTIKDWNFLIFLNGVNNLDSFGQMNINQMEEVGSNEQLNILVQWGSLERASTDRLLVQKDNSPQVTSPVVDSRPDADMGSWHELVDFVSWAQTNYPARQTFLVIWNHGSGWRKLNLADTINVRDISSDDRTGSKITTEELGLAMAEISQRLGHKIDIYGSDACLMGMVEVADQVADSVDYFVGSQDLEPGAGWPYSTFLSAWTQDMSRSPQQVAQLLSREYLQAYSGGIYGRQPVTMSVLNLGKMDLYRDALRTLGEELNLLAFTQRQNLKQAARNTKSFFYADYRDIIDFLNQVERRSLTLASATTLRAAHSEFVISNDQSQGQRTFGLSIWLPTDPWNYDSHHERYLGLSFHRQTGWGQVARIISE